MLRLAGPRLRFVGNPGNRRRSSIAADNSPVGIGFGDDEHPQTMVVRTMAGNRNNAVCAALGFSG
jgi:hypothetical protein